MPRNVQPPFNNAPFYTGTSGLVVPIRQSEYPPLFQGKSRLSYYSSIFNSLEVNSIFYKLPRASTVANWADEVSEEFQFSFKLSKQITHVPDLAYSLNDLTRFFEVVNHVREKRGVVLLQFPPKLKIDRIDRLEELLTDIKLSDPDSLWRIAVEFRNTGWYDDEVYQLLGQYNASVVIHDLPPSSTPPEISTADFRYVRFHGPEKAYRGTYSDPVIEFHAREILNWLRQGITVYTYFNNTMGEAFTDLQKLNRLVSAEVGK